MNKLNLNFKKETFDIQNCFECVNYDLGACEGCKFETECEKYRIEDMICTYITKYNVKVNVENINRETLDKLQNAILEGKVQERTNKKGVLDIDLTEEGAFIVFVPKEIEYTTEENLKDFSNKSYLKVDGTYATLGATNKQQRTLKMFVYNYKISISADCLSNRQKASQKITEIYKAIEEGRVKKRQDKTPNTTVKIVDNKLSLVIDKKRVRKQQEQYINGFDEFNQRTNASQYVGA